MNANFILSNLGISLVIFIIVAITVAVILRLILPFSIFRIKDLVEQSLEEQKKTNELLASLLKALNARDESDI